MITNCTITENIACDAPGRPPGDRIGGGMYIGYASPTITNTILFGNHDEFDDESSINDEIYNYSGIANPSFRSSDVNHCGGSGDGWNAIVGNDGLYNIAQDPVFRDKDNPDGRDSIWATYDDGLRLDRGSPCIDAADGDAAPPRDITGFARFDDCEVANTGIGMLKYVDIGAYEHRELRISGGEYHTLMLELDGTLLACGGNVDGQLGIGTYNDGPKLTLVRVKGENGYGYLNDIWWTDAGFYHSLAVGSSEGYVFAWGRNTAGQIGNGSAGLGKVQPTPVKVLSGQQGGGTYLHDIVKVSAGRSGEYSLACDRTENRNAWAWGLNDTGQLGDGDGPPNWPNWKETPVHVVTNRVTKSPLTGVVDIDAGIHHSIGLDTSGYVWTWGSNSYGQLGDGTTEDRDYAKEVVGLGGAGHIVDVAVTCGLSGPPYLESSYALEDAPDVEDGYVWAWGDNSEGQLGRGPSGPPYSPTPLKVVAGGQGGTDLHDIVAVSAGNYHVLALDKNGNVWAWGDNILGQLGNGDLPNDSKVPVRVKKNVSGVVTDLTDIVTIDAGFYHSLAVDVEDNVWVWGANASGQLGLGNKQNKEYATPMQ